MKSKDFVILGIAVAIYLLWKNNKTKKTTTSTTITEGGVTNGTTTISTTGGGTITIPTSNEPEQIFGVSLPTGMDLPVLTAGTGIPTEVGVQQGLGTTTPIPVVAPIKEVSTEDVLVMGGIKPIVKDNSIPQALDIPQTPIIPTTQPTETPISIIKDERRSECGNSFSVPNFDKEGSSTNYWFDGKFYYSQNTNPFIKLVRTKISESDFIIACEKLQSIKMSNTKI
jgi:hypothetical protein